MSGTELKQILNAAGVNFTQVARMLGMSQQNFYNLFVAQDVKSGTLERISTAIGHKYGSRVTAVYINPNQKRVDDLNRRMLELIFGA